MRRIQVVLEPELDDRLEQEAAARGMSKSALVRACLRERLVTEPFDNGIMLLAGLGEGQSTDSVRHDDVIYEWGYHQT